MNKKIKRNINVEKIQNAISNMSSAYKSNNSIIVDHMQEEAITNIFQRMLEFKQQSRNDKGDNSFEKLQSIYKKYDPLDVFKSLSIAELWLPNLSSFVGFSLAINAFLNLESKDFSVKKIDTYEIFIDFISEVFQHIPHNPMIEDFHPIKDWGQVKYQFKNQAYKILFGSYGFSDILGFIDSFLVNYEGNEQAINDFSKILELHNNLLDSVDENDWEDNQNHSFTFNTPTIKFWEQVSTWFDELSLGNINLDLVVQLGQVKNNNKDFYEEFMEGNINQYCYFSYFGKSFPISLRNSFIVLLQHYHTQNIYALDRAGENISIFLKKRLHHDITDPFVLRNNNKVLPYRFSGYLKEENEHYFILPVFVDQISLKIEKDIESIINSDNWGIQSLDGYGGIIIKQDDGNKVKVDEVNILVVLCDVTANTLIIPKFNSKNFKIFSLHNFLSIIDSIDDKSTFIDYLKFVESNENKALFMGYDIDSYATFKDTSGILEDGAIKSTVISLDTHWGANWKYKYLQSNYSALPTYLPDLNCYWTVAKKYENNICLYAKNKKAISWSVELKYLTLHFLFDFLNVDIKLHSINPKLVELCAEAFCDAFSKRINFFDELCFKEAKSITFNLLISSSLENDYIDESYNSRSVEVINNYIVEEKSKDSFFIEIYLNLDYCFYSFQNSTDASFQVQLCKEVLEVINKLDKIENKKKLYDLLDASEKWPLRMTMESLNNPFDFFDPISIVIPEKFYKLGRQKIAVILRDKGFQPGTYNDISEAKEIINLSATELRKSLHEKIKKISKEKLLNITLESYQKLISENYVKNVRHKQSLKHEVVFDRTESLSEVDNKFVRDSSNYRYLIECCLMLDSQSVKDCQITDVLEILGEVHWLLNLYQYSDILHYGLDVGGISIDSTFIPEVFFNGHSQIIEDSFNKEIASYKLGLGLNSVDELKSTISENNYKSLDECFYKDLSFSFTNLNKVLYILSNWFLLNSIPQAPICKESIDEVCKKVISHIGDNSIGYDEVNLILNFLVLDKNKINLLEGSDVKTFDVPVGDHNKRTFRLNIRPLILLDDNKTLLWTTGCTYRSQKIWISNIEGGYLPADFSWENTKNLISQSKTLLEKQLEKKASNVLSRKSKYTETGLDLITRFKKMNFPKIGDYDVLSYFPNYNIWVMIECKYNQPAFCLKDMRRLRDKIFGENKESKSQISKVQTRYEYLKNNLELVRDALQWPRSSKENPTILNLYVSKNTYWWFRNPPYQLDTSFIQIDYLDQWLTDNLPKID